MSVPVKILADASLPGLAILFQDRFSLTLYQTQQQIADVLPLHDVLLCRSTLRVDASLLTNSIIQCVATASSGTDHIDSEYLTQHHISLFDAKGSNARAVADYVVSTIAVHQPIGKLAGVIGVGEVGSRVVKRLHAAGFKVICFDPFKAHQDKHHHYVTLDELTACDLLCIHANFHESAPFPSKNLLNTDFLAQLKPGVTLINASRGGIVDEEALLKMSQPITYCTDVYCNEPSINPRIVDFATVCTPHIAGHSIEAKQAAVVQLSQQLHQHYGFPMPSHGLPTLKNHPVISTKNNWRECILSAYTPLVDTFILKSALDKKTAFLTQRKEHQHRHDFNYYVLSDVDQQTQLLLGKGLDE